MLFTKVSPLYKLFERARLSLCWRLVSSAAFLSALMIFFYAPPEIVRAGAVCPTVNRKMMGWPKDSVVYYEVDALPPKVREQVLRAIMKWNEANQSNGSGVVFKEKERDGTVDYIFSIGWAEGHTAATYITRDEDRFVVKAETVIDFDKSHSFSPLFDGYNTVFEKITLHEIGHTMGLKDVAVSNSFASCGGQIPLTSVMNGLCGLNESSNNIPLQPSECDQRAVKEKFESQKKQG